jgi:L-arabonate dehydrase
MTRRLRSRAWFEGSHRNNFIHRGWLRNQGTPSDQFDGRPVIGICNTWSELTPCNAHLREIAEHVRRGVLDAGGYPLEFPVMSLGESLMRPTTMLYRNLVSMDVEESIRANPVDGVVLLSGCDKTTPSLLMGAASVDLPTLMVTGGPMLNGRLRGRTIGSGTSLWEFSEQVRAGQMTKEEFLEAEVGMNRSAGHCMSMGTASTMACLVEAMGVSLPHGGALPAVDARRRTLARLSGRRIVDMVREDLRLSRVLDERSFRNAAVACSALGGSTNAIVHLLALAGRVNVRFSLDDWEAAAHDVPCIVDLMPAGRWLMEDFCYAGGVPAMLAELGGLFDGSARSVWNGTLGSSVASARNDDRKVIRGLDDPVSGNGGVAVLRGNLAERGAVIKTATASPALMEHVGRALVFASADEMRSRIDDPALEVRADDVLVLQNVGPRGYPGFPEVGNLPMPRRLLESGVRDMLRISDGRMSGTAFGTIVLHVAPEAAVGGNLALVRNGDLIALSVSRRRLDLLVPDDELARRRAEWRAPAAQRSGYAQLYTQHVLQADEGADFDFLVGRRGADVPAESH